MGKMQGKLLLVHIIELQNTFAFDSLEQMTLNILSLLQI